MSDKYFLIPASTFIGVVRCAIAFIWLYEGLWKKVLAPDHHELMIVTSAGRNFEMNGAWTLGAIGLAEVALAIWVFTGIKYRYAAFIQALALITMNLSGILLGGGTIKNPTDLLIHNIPLLLSIALVGLYGPGAWAICRSETAAGKSGL